MNLLLLPIKNIFNSLQNRVLISALFMVLILVPLVGLIISSAYEKHMLRGINSELSAYSYSILAIAEVEKNVLLMPEQLLNTEFNVSQSGLYAALTSNKQKIANKRQPSHHLLWTSQSLLTTWSPDKLRSPLLGQNDFYTVTIDNAPHFIYSLSINYGDTNTSFPMTLHIIKSKDNMTAMMNEFHKKLLLGLAGLMGILLLIQYLWSSWTLKPLNLLHKELQAVEQGKSEQLQKKYPTELSKVTEQLNLLLDSEQKQRLRYRNALSDLAHSLKTPLAVIQSETNLSTQTQEQLSIINSMLEHQLKKAQSAGQSAWHLGTAIKPVAEKLISSLKKIYREKDISFKVSISKSAKFRGDESDLLEILGNLLDNACKASNGIVQLTIFAKSQQLHIVVKDNGSGIKPDMQHDILERGTRADTYQSGHGIGLAIVRDLVISYQGTLTIDNSTSLKGAKFTLCFSL